MKKSALPCLIVLLILSAVPLSAAEPSGEEKRLKLEWELDAYYASVGLYASLTQKPIPYVGEKSEWEIYRMLVKKSYLPRTAILEASVNPLPYAGTLLRKERPEFYRSMKLNNSLNLVQAVTEGFEEPWALSFFLGDVVEFKSSRSAYAGKRHGYIGYLLSSGNFHIKDSELVADNWLEAEWKIKGEQFLEKRSLRWSLRAGAKFHDHPEIADIFYAAVRRSRTDFGGSGGFFLNNSGFEYRFDFAQRDLAPMRHYFSLDKKIPLERLKIALTCAVGFVWTGPEKYTGILAGQSGERDPFQIFLRPNIEF